MMTPEKLNDWKQYFEAGKNLVEAIAAQLCSKLTTETEQHKVLDELRDTLVSKGVAPLQAANLVRLGIAHANVKHTGTTGYTPQEQKIIIDKAFKKS